MYVKMLVTFGQSATLSTGNCLLFWSIRKVDFMIDQIKNFIFGQRKLIFMI